MAPPSAAELGRTVSHLANRKATCERIFLCRRWRTADREPLQAGSLPLCVLEVENFELDIRSGSHHVIERVDGIALSFLFYVAFGYSASN
jgi:hypothetical protein